MSHINLDLQASHKMLMLLDEANAMAELDTKPVDDAKALEQKYSAAATSASVDAELEQMKKDLGM